MIKRSTEITTLFLDIGGVLLTNGWDHHARKRTAANFKLELTEMEDRRHLTFDTYEEGKLTLEEYLSRVVFYQVRKPDADIFRLALDITPAPPRQVVCNENTPMFVQIAPGLGIRSILYTDYKSTRAKLASFGLSNGEGVIHETG
ncbi:MAG: hypothetical protein PHX83_04815 [Acidobacteriia bacterium]|nr:hypothetical protein [Terriglobia bacterium]